MRRHPGSPPLPPLALLLPVLLLPGCLDALGEREIVTEHSSLVKDELRGDRLEDKHPVYDPELQVVDEIRGSRVTLNKSAALLQLDIGPMQSAAERRLGEELFPSYAAAAAALDGETLIPSLEVVHGKLKVFDDAFYGATEKALQLGLAEVWAGKVTLYRDLLEAVRADLATTAPAHRPFLEEAVVRLASGLTLAGEEIPLDATLAGQVEQEVARFLDDELLSRPVGFYAEDETLAQVFRQDRYHQQWAGGPPRSLYARGPSFGALLVLAHYLGSDPARHAQYLAVERIYEGLTNPYAAYSVADLLPQAATLAGLDDPDAAWAEFQETHPPIYELAGAPYSPVALIPSSASQETRLFNRLFPEGVPEGVSLMDALIREILAGEVDLAPLPGSGWYDYQVYALETLLLPEKGPESNKLLLSKAYKEKLIESFKTMLTQTRETHVKQLNIGGEARSADMTPEPLEVHPVLHAEPFPTYYLRQARAYRFVAGFVTATLGPEFLAATPVELPSRGSLPLDEALAATTRLCYGLYLLTAGDVGLATDLLPEELAEFPAAASLAEARAWLAGLPADLAPPWPETGRPGFSRDPDLAVDPRVIVPVQLDPEGFSVCWAVIGVRALKIRAEFVPGHEPEVVDCEGCEVEGFVPTEPYLFVGKQVEVRIRTAAAAMTRAEFRALCDAHRTTAAIVEALESR